MYRLENEVMVEMDNLSLNSIGSIDVLINDANHVFYTVNLDD